MALVPRVTQRVSLDADGKETNGTAVSYAWTVQLISEAPFRRGDDLVVASTQVVTDAALSFTNLIITLRAAVAALRSTLGRARDLTIVNEALTSGNAS